MIELAGRCPRQKQPLEKMCLASGVPACDREVIAGRCTDHVWLGLLGGYSVTGGRTGSQSTDCHSLRGKVLRCSSRGLKALRFARSLVVGSGGSELDFAAVRSALAYWGSEQEQGSVRLLAPLRAARRHCGPASRISSHHR